jgi:hypothetical protein
LFQRHSTTSSDPIPTSTHRTRISNTVSLTSSTHTTTRSSFLSPIISIAHSDPSTSNISPVNERSWSTSTTDNHSSSSSRRPSNTVHISSPSSRHTSTQNYAPSSNVFQSKSISSSTSTSPRLSSYVTTWTSPPDTSTSTQNNIKTTLTPTLTPTPSPNQPTSFNLTSYLSSLFHASHAATWGGAVPSEQGGCGCTRTNSAPGLPKYDATALTTTLKSTSTTTSTTTLFLTSSSRHHQTITPGPEKENKREHEITSCTDLPSVSALASAVQGVVEESNLLGTASCTSAGPPAFDSTAAPVLSPAPCIQGNAIISTIQTGHGNTMMTTTAAATAARMRMAWKIASVLLAWCLGFGLD